MANENKPKSRDTELVVQELKDEVLVFDLHTNKAYCLNPTSTMIWNLCNGQSSVSDITEQLSKKLTQPVTDELVWLALDQFKKDDLLSNGKDLEINFAGLSRRQVIRKIGFTSMLALPVISSLVAPTAVMAQSGAGSGGAVGQSCTGAGVGSCDPGTAYCSNNTCLACLTAGTNSLCLEGPISDCPRDFGFQCCSGLATTNFGCPTPTPGYVHPPGMTIQCFCS
jgi:hypothetical protein